MNCLDSSIPLPCLSRYLILRSPQKAWGSQWPHSDDSLMQSVYYTPDIVLNGLQHWARTVVPLGVCFIALRCDSVAYHSHLAITANGGARIATQAVWLLIPGLTHCLLMRNHDDCSCTENGARLLLHTGVGGGRRELQGH